MNTKVILVLALGVLCVTAIPAFAYLPDGTCSGDECGCGLEAEQCREGCQQGDYDCLGACKRELVRCSICCCCDAAYCSLRCGWSSENSTVSDPPSMGLADGASGCAADLFGPPPAEAHVVTGLDGGAESAPAQGVPGVVTGR